MDIVQKACADFGIKDYCINLDDMFWYDLDLIVVLTRHEDHFSNIQSILNKWINVYSEKPFAENFEQWNELISLASSKWLTLWSAPQVMLSRRNQKLKNLLSDWILWPITLIKASCSNLWPAWRKDTDYDPEWFYNSWWSLKSLGIYTLSILVWLFGMPKRVSSFMWIALPEREVLYWPFSWKKFRVTAYDNVIAQFDYWNGMYVIFDAAYVVPHQSKNEFEISWEKWSLYISGFGWPNSIIFRNLEWKEMPIGPEDNSHEKWNLSWGVEETINAIIEKRESLTNSQFALKTIRLMDIMESSSKTNTIQDISELNF